MSDEGRTLTILHLSDMQFGKHHRFGRLGYGGADEPFDTLLRRLTDDLDLLASTEEVRPDIVALTGDLAEWGLKREFGDVLELCEGLRKHLGLDPDRIVVVPGNHDINRNLCEAYFATCAGEETKPVEPYWPKWKHYLTLFDTLYKPVERYRFTESEPWTLFEIADLRVVIAGLNSTMRESHRADDHYGWLGEAQLRWFADKLRDYESRGWLRVGVVHHNALRRAEHDDENLRDADGLREHLGERLNLLLHGHRHQGRVEMLGLTLPVLSTGSASLKIELRPDETPNQYQLVRVRRDGFEIFARQYTPERKKWIGDTRVSAKGDSARFSHKIEFARVEGTFPTVVTPRREEPVEGTRPSRAPGLRRTDLFGERETDSDDLLARVGRVAKLRKEPGETREVRRVRSVGAWGDHVVVSCTRGIVFEIVVGAVESALTEALLDRWCSEVHDPFVRRSPGARSELVIDGAAPHEELVRRARSRGVLVETLTRYQGLIDFSDYLKRQNAELASNEVYPPEVYVRQRIAYKGSELGHSTDAAETVIGWATQRDKRFTLVLGQFGAGKTFLMREVARRLGDGRAGVVPLLIEMRELNKSSALGALIMSHLANHGVQNATLESFYYMLDAGMVVLLFDGFDELATRISYDAVLDHFATLTEAAARGRVMVSTRTQFFKDARHADTALMKAAQREHNLVEVSLEEFTPEDVRDFLERRYRDVERAARRVERIGDIHDLLGLSRNPRMLSFIADLPDADLDAAEANDGTITSAQLYDMLIERWLKFERERQLRGDHSDPATISEMRAALLELACTLWRTTERTVPVSELKHAAAILIERIGRPIDHHKPALKPDEGTFALGSGTMLVRDAEGNFGFIHQSVLEWFVAREAATEIDRGGATTLLNEQPLSDLMADFVWGLLGRENARAWAESVLQRRKLRDTLDGNLRKLLARMGVEANVIYDGRGKDLRAGDLSGVSLVNAQLDGADLRGVDLSGRDLSGASLVGARLAYANLRGANLTRAILDNADLAFAMLDGATLEGARLVGAHVLGTKLLATIGEIGPGERRRAETAAGAIDSRSIEVFARSSDCFAVAFSPDGLLLATVHDDGTVRIWDPERGVLLRLLLGHTARVTCVVWSPDGTRIATGAYDNTLRVWAVASGKELCSFNGHGAPVPIVSWSPDGTCLASGSHDSTVRLWEVASGREVRVLVGHGLGVSSIAWSPDGRRIATGAFDTTVRVWEVASGDELRAFTAHQGSISTVAWNHDGTRLASGAKDASVRIWEVASGAELFVLVGHQTNVSSIAWSPDGGFIASASYDFTVSLWGADTGMLIRTLKGHEGIVSSVAWSPDGVRLASGSLDSTVRIWEVSGGKALRVLQEIADPVWSVAWSPDGRRLACGEDDGNLWIWNASGGGGVRVNLNDGGYTRSILSVAWSPDGSRVASGASDNRLRLFSAANGNRIFSLAGHTDWIRSVEFSPTGTHIASGADDNTVRLWDAYSGKHLRAHLGHTGMVLSVAWSPGGQRLASGSFDMTIRLWGVASGVELMALTGHTDGVNCVAWSPDGELLASASYDTTVRLWNAAFGTKVRVFAGHSNRVWTVAWSPDGERLASGGDDKTVRLWDVASGQELAVLRGHAGAVNSVMWRRGGRHLVSASDDGTIRVWDATTHQCIAVYMPTPSGVVAFRPRDGRYRVYGNADGSVWHVIGLARYELGELDPYVPGGLKLGDDEVLVPPP